MQQRVLEVARDILTELGYERLTDKNALFEIFGVGEVYRRGEADEFILSKYTVHLVLYWKYFSRFVEEGAILKTLEEGLSEYYLRLTLLNDEVWIIRQVSEYRLSLLCRNLDGEHYTDTFVAGQLLLDKFSQLWYNNVNAL